MAPGPLTFKSFGNTPAITARIQDACAVQDRFHYRTSEQLGLDMQRPHS